MRAFWFSCLIWMVISCTKKPAEKPDTFSFLEGEKLAELTEEKIQEASGLAASISNKGLLWTHNDSGNPAEVFLVDRKLNIRLICRLEGIPNRDWEDIATGPGPDPSKNYVYVADIGDNMAQYPYKMIYRFEEPDITKKNVKGMIIEKVDKIVFQLEDKIKDAETLMVHPATGDIFVVSKRENPVVLYRIPFSRKNISDTVMADSVCPIPLTQVVAGDFSSDGKSILLKNYQNVFLWESVGGEPIEKTFSRPGKILPYKEEPQGEAIAFARDGSGYFTISEKVRGEKSYLLFYRRK